VLTIYLRQNFARSLDNLQSRHGAGGLIDSPDVVGPRAQIEGQRNCGTVFLLDVFSKVQAVLGIESALIAATGVFVKYVGKTEIVKEACRCKTKEDPPPSRGPNLTANPDLRQRRTAIWT
jgi:hypothetical protein